MSVNSLLWISVWKNGGLQKIISKTDGFLNVYVKPGQKTWERKIQKCMRVVTGKVEEWWGKQKESKSGRKFQYTEQFD